MTFCTEIIASFESFVAAYANAFVSLIRMRELRAFVTGCSHHFIYYFVVIKPHELKVEPTDCGSVVAPYHLLVSEIPT